MMRAERVPLTPVKNKMVAAEVAARWGPVGNAGLLLAAAELRGAPGQAGGSLAALRHLPGTDGLSMKG